MGDITDKPDTPTPADAPDAAALKLQLDSQTEQMSRLQKDNERLFNFIEENLKQKSEPKVEPKPEEKEEPEEELNLAEIAAENDKRGFAKLVRSEANKLLKEKGYLKKDEAERIVTERLQTQTQAAQTADALKDKYPELKDTTSDLYQETTRQFQVIASNPLYKDLSDVAKAWMAAERAELEMRRSGKIGPPQKESEAERQARIAQQQGRTNSRTRSTSETDDGLTDEEREFVGAFGKIYGVTADDYKKNKAVMAGKRR